ncbi:LysR family transcriptional regulator [Saccharospirillum impatiens]|uniref:LysR family transcriptional regulator n=1 Tax=Saccharospirillum impatiens TaxID=169438 RepID=UPI000413110C|nr:LysR family transcriptional regulator [Saccharospirillum impatiens]
MDTLDNIKTFLAVVRTGSFSAAGRELDIVPSVVTKRVNQLEHQLKATLFIRSTRKLELTDTGERYYPRFLGIVSDVEEAFRDVASTRSRIEDHLRIKCPTTLTVMYFGKIFTAFQKAYPGVRLDLVLMDRSVNPVEEGFDIAIGALPSSYTNVVDLPLCRMPRTVVASQGYIEKYGEPQHPRDLLSHHCLSFLATGNSWFFDGPSGSININVSPSLTVNDSLVLLDAVKDELGIAILPRHIVHPFIKSGKLKSIMPEFPVGDLWVKALVPENRQSIPAVKAALDWLQAATQPQAPWDRTDVDDNS